MFLTYTGATIVYTSGVEVYETHNESIDEVGDSIQRSLSELGAKALVTNLDGGDVNFHILTPSNIAYIQLHEVRL